MVSQGNAAMSVMCVAINNYYFVTNIVLSLKIILKIDRYFVKLLTFLILSVLMVVSM